MLTVQLPGLFSWTRQRIYLYCIPSCTTASQNLSLLYSFRFFQHPRLPKLIFIVFLQVFSTSSTPKTYLYCIPSGFFNILDSQNLSLLYHLRLCNSLPKLASPEDMIKTMRHRTTNRLYLISVSKSRDSHEVIKV